MLGLLQKRDPFDSAMVESFVKTLRPEEVYLWEYETLANVEKRPPYFGEEIYDRKRLHFSLGYLAPNDFERMLLENHNPIGSFQIR
jgi:transposase InsO family protein